MTSITGICPVCRGPENAEVVVENEEVLEPTMGSPYVEGHAYRILKCDRCKTIYFQHESLQISDTLDFHVYDDDYDDDDPKSPVPAANLQELRDFAEELTAHSEQFSCYEEIEYWPKPTPPKPRWLREIPDEPLTKRLNAIYSVLDNDDSRTLAAIAMRSVFERACDLIGIHPDKTFAKKLDQLHNDGHITADDKEILYALTDSGNAAAHRAWEPNLEQLKTLVSIMEHFLRAIFKLKKEAKKLRESLPSRPKYHPPEDPERKAELIQFPVQK